MEIYKHYKKILEFVAQAHEGQKRKYTGEPYISHPIEVAELVKLAPSHTPIMVYSGLLHDVIEDTAITIIILREFLQSIGLRGRNVNLIVNMVSGLTDVSTPEHGNRAFRKAIDLNHLSIQIPQTKTVKLADIISNTKTIVQYDSKFAKTYIPEKIALLKVLKEGDSELYRMACYEVEKAKIRIGV